jgi:hypothetical protein
MLQTQVLRDFSSLSGVSAEWAALHRSANPGSPFEHPAWALTWAEHFVPDGRLECLAIRDTAGKLVGFAPLYRKRLVKFRSGPTSIQPIGTGYLDSLTEVVQLLSQPDHVRKVTRSVARHLESVGDVDWFQISLGPNQGWLIPQWLETRATSSIIHRATRACVVLDPYRWRRCWYFPTAPQTIFR